MHPQDQVIAFEKLFACRRETFVRFWQKNDKVGFSPAYIFDWDVYNQHRAKGGNFVNFTGKQLKKLETQDFLSHLQGKEQIAIFPEFFNQTSQFSCLKINHTSWQTLFLELVKLCTQIQVTIFCSNSKNRTESYFWLFYDGTWQVSKTQILWKYLLKAATKNLNLALAQKDFEILPNSTDDFIILPYFNSTTANNVEVFLDTDLQPITEFSKVLETIEKNDILRLNKIIQLIEQKESLKNHNQVLEITINNQIWLPKASLPSNLLQFLETCLKIENSEFSYKTKIGIKTLGTPKYFNLIEDSLENLVLPRGFFSRLVRFLKQQKIEYKLIDKRNILPKVEIISKIELLPFQTRVLKEIENKSEGIIQAPPGSGKTVMALQLISQKQQPTLIIVHRNSLLEQWMERIGSFLELEEGDLGQIAGKKKFLGKKITVATIQSLAKFDLEQLKNAFGTIIVDECHHTPANSFAKIISQLNSTFLYGLTATPIRKYSDEQLIFLYLGEILAVVTPEEKFSHTEPTLEVNIRQTELQIPFEPNNMEMEVLLKILLYDSNRNLMITQDVISELKKNQKILILTERVEHLAVLKNYLQSHAKILTVSGEDPARTKKVKLKKIDDGDFDILISTGQFFGEGMDFPNLDVLFLVFPFSFHGKLIQYIGRIQRSSKHKIIYDYHDMYVNYFNLMFKKREKYYRSLNLQKVRVS